MSPEIRNIGEYMPAAKAPLLSYADLIRPKGFVKIIEPNEIPIHPDVYSSKLVYMKEFVVEVAESVPNSIRQDVLEIQRVLGSNLGVNVTEEEIIRPNTKTRFVDFIPKVVPGEAGLEVEVEYVPGNATIIALAREGYCKRVFRPDSEYPMSEEKLKAYGFVPGDYDVVLPTWYIHNLSFAGLGGLLYFRNFALMFNNLGIKRVGDKS